MANGSVPQKQCSICKNYFPATREYFSPHKTTRDKLEGRCKSCQRERSRKRREDPNVCEKANKHERDRLATDPEYYEQRRRKDRERKRKLMRNPEFREKRNQKRRERRIHDPEYREQDNQKQRERRNDPVLAEKNRQNSRDWRKTPHGKILMRDAKRRRRAKRLGAGGTHKAIDIVLQYKSQKGRCWHCGKALNGKYEVDHLIPLDRGGSDWPSNLVCSCQRCNRSKGNKLPQEWNGKMF